MQLFFTVELVKKIEIAFHNFQRNSVRFFEYILQASPQKIDYLWLSFQTNDFNYDLFADLVSKHQKKIKLDQIKLLFSPNK